MLSNNSINCKLSKIYETNMVPLRNILIELRKQIEYLSDQQKNLNKILHDTKKDKFNKYKLNKRKCICLRRKL